MAFKLFKYSFDKLDIGLGLLAVNAESNNGIIYGESIIWLTWDSELVPHRFGDENPIQTIDGMLTECISLAESKIKSSARQKYARKYNDGNLTQVNVDLDLKEITASDFKDSPYQDALSKILNLTKSSELKTFIQGHISR